MKMKKRCMSLLLSLLMILSFCSQLAFTAGSAADTGDAAAVIEDIQITVEDVTYTFNLDTESKTACMTDIAESAEAITVTVPKTFEYNGEVYTTTELWWGAFSAERTNIRADHSGERSEFRRKLPEYEKSSNAHLW